MSKISAVYMLVFFFAMLAVISVEAQYYANQQPSNYLSAYPQQFNYYGDGFGADSWQRSVVGHVVFP